MMSLWPYIVEVISIVGLKYVPLVRKPSRLSLEGVYDHKSAENDFTISLMWPVRDSYKWSEVIVSISSTAQFDCQSRSVCSLDCKVLHDTENP